MIPDLYSMNYRTHKDSLALCEPMYYSYPDQKEAYEIRNEYFFGSELLVVPVTSPASKRTNLSKTRVWLPKGTWTDIYTGYIYEGEKFVNMYRGIESIPVLAKEGAIVPLSQNDRTNDCSNPADMKVRVYTGNNTFDLYEDDGETMNFEKGQYAVTKMVQTTTASDIVFEIRKAEGDTSVLPTKRNYTLSFENVKDAKEITVTVNGKIKNAEIIKKLSHIEIVLTAIKPKDTVTVVLSGFEARQNKSKKTLITDTISKYQLTTAYKKLKFNSYIKDVTKPFPVNDEDLKGPIDEINALK